jgi:hypothetical protein
MFPRPKKGRYRMVKKVFADVYAICSNGSTWRGKKTEVSKSSKMAIADLFEVYRDYIKENGDGAKLKEFHVIFDEGV